LRIDSGASGWKSNSLLLQGVLGWQDIPLSPATLQHFYGAISPSCSSHSEPHSDHWEVAGFPWVKTCLC
jgi:hypothetical protein